MLITCLLQLNSLADFDQEQIDVIYQQINDVALKDYPDWDDIDDTAKKAQLSAMITQLSGPTLTKQWNHSSGGAWPVVDWTQVAQTNTFFSDQLQFFKAPNAITQTHDEVAKFTISGVLVHSSSTVGGLWFREWLKDVVTSDDQNRKMLVYWFIGELGEDRASIAASEEESPAGNEELNPNWNEWKNTYDQSDKLGKAILLKCLTR